MPSILDRLLGREPKSASLAKERLKLVLVFMIARTCLRMCWVCCKDELIAAISRHIDIDADAVRIEIAQDGREQRLIADIPLRSQKSAPLRLRNDPMQK